MRLVTYLPNYLRDSWTVLLLTYPHLSSEVWQWLSNFLLYSRTFPVKSHAKPPRAAPAT